MSKTVSAPMRKTAGALASVVAALALASCGSASEQAMSEKLAAAEAAADKAVAAQKAAEKAAASATRLNPAPVVAADDELEGGESPVDDDQGDSGNTTSDGGAIVPLPTKPDA